MTRLFLALAVAVAAVVPALAQDTPAVKAAKALNGSYTVASASFDGQPAPADVVKPITGVEIKDGVITVKTGKKDDAAKFTADPAQNPPAIDITGKPGDKPKPGIYKVEKDQLTIAFSSRGTRPTDFTPAEGVRILVLTRKAEPKKVDPKPVEPKKN